MITYTGGNLQVSPDFASSIVDALIKGISNAMNVVISVLVPIIKVGLPIAILVLLIWSLFHFALSAGRRVK